MSGSSGDHGLTGVADAAAFLARLTRLNPATLVRLRSEPGGARTALWARLPWAALVSRTVPGPGPGDTTVSAAGLLAEVTGAGPGLPARRNAAWRWPLPPGPGRVVETLTAAEVRRVAAAAEQTLRTVMSEGIGGRAVGLRKLRDALLDHVAIVVTEPAPATDAAVPTPPETTAEAGPTGGPNRIEVSQRLVQAVVRMGFLGEGAAAPDAPVQVRIVERWIALSAPYGVAWLPPANRFAVRGPIRTNRR